MPDPEEVQQWSISNLGASKVQMITVINHQLNIKPLQISNDWNKNATRWDKCKRDIEQQFRFFGISDPELKSPRRRTVAQYLVST